MNTKDNKISRRNLIKGFGLGLGTVSLGISWPLLATAEEKNNSQKTTKKPWHQIDFIGDELMDNRLLWYLSATWQKMADIGECLETASRIKAGSVQSWWQEWLYTANRVCKIGDTCLKNGHKISAGEAYMRAANYYRAALIYYEQPKDPNLLIAVQKSVKCFETALSLLSIPASPIEIPYEKSSLPGYFFHSPIAAKQAPLLIVFEGWDAWPEEVMYIAEGAIKRGYHCLVFHGPGQGRALRQRGLTFRYDWEKVVTPVVDFAVKIPGVDHKRMALMGISFGGALATRAAAFEKRLKLCIANPAVYRWWDVIDRTLFSSYPQLRTLLEKDPKRFNVVMNKVGKNIPAYDWWVNATMWKHGVSTPAQLMKEIQKYTNEEIIGKIKCRMLIMDGQAEAWSYGQAQKVYGALSCPKDFMLFTREDTGEVHCQTGALAIAGQRMFDWLDDYI